jgi:hypothetical protein|tara:strand:- start:7294 stop:7707 length:414 start_codon:yes stop_codon:yes gene_type:complete
MYILPIDIQENILNTSYRLYYSETVLPYVKKKHEIKQIIDSKYKYNSVIDELNYHLPYIRGCDGLKFICNSFIEHLQNCETFQPYMLLEEYFENFVFFHLVINKEFANRFEPYSIHLNLIERYYEETLVEYFSLNSN